MPKSYQIKQGLFGVSLVVISWLSLLPGDKLERTMHIRTMSSSGAYLHIAAYAVLALLAWWAFERRYKMVLLFLLVYGIILELIQIGVPNRSFNPFDIASNLMGLLIASLMISGWQRIRQSPMLKGKK